MFGEVSARAVSSEKIYIEGALASPFLCKERYEGTWPVTLSVTRYAEIL